MTNPLLSICSPFQFQQYTFQPEINAIFNFDLLFICSRIFYKNIALEKKFYNRINDKLIKKYLIYLRKVKIFFTVSFKTYNI